MKKAISALLCGALVVPLVACNGGGLREKYAQQSLEKLYERFEGDIERGTAAKPITLHVLENDTAKKSGYLKELLDGFNKMYAEYHIVAIDANQDQFSDLAENGPYGYGPDVLYQANDILMRYCDGKHIIPLPIEKLDAYEYLPDLVKDTYTYSLGGHDYFMGVGVNMQAPMLYYRKDLLPENWETEWDADGNGVFDPIEDMRAMYRWSIARNAANSDQYGFMQSYDDPYFSCGYLFSYGAYVFGDDNTDMSDIGFDAANAELGAGIILQLAGVMNSGCVDNSITVARESEFARGSYFAVPNTQDMYGTLFSETVAAYRKQGMTAAEANAAANENICAVPMPDLPVSGDLTETEGDTIESIVMGGVSAYAISSYTEYPKASLAFLNYATSYEQALRRNEVLGIAPARSDANADCTVQADVAHSLLDMYNDNRISVMPSVSGVSQIWTPLATAFTEIATDPYRPGGKKFTKQDGRPNYVTLNALLDDLCDNIYNAIYTLA